MDNGLVALLIEDHLGQSRAKKKSRSNLSVKDSSDHDSEQDSGSSSEGDLDSTDITASDDSGRSRGYSSSDKFERGRKGEAIKRGKGEIGRNGENEAQSDVEFGGR